MEFDFFWLFIKILMIGYLNFILLLFCWLYYVRMLFILGEIRM